jgi:hypothetical protein
VQFTANADGSLAGPYGDIQNLDSSAHDAAVAAVSTIEVVANGGAFPDVQLTVRALDGSGAPVFGLGVNDFAVTDESKAQQALLVSNARAVGVRVLVAYDCSLSIVWPTPADKTAFNNPRTGVVSSAAKNPFARRYAARRQRRSIVLQSCRERHRCFRIGLRVSPICGSRLAGRGRCGVPQSSSCRISTPRIRRTRSRAAAGLAASGLEVADPTAGETDVIDQIVSRGGHPADPTATDFAIKLDDFVTKATERVTTSGYRFSYRVPPISRARRPGPHRRARQAPYDHRERPTRSPGRSAGYGVAALEIESDPSP